MDRPHLQERDPATPQVVEGPDGSESSAALLREAIDETRELVRLEVELARQELGGEILRAKTAGAAFGGAAVMGTVGIALLFASIAFAVGRSWLCALLMGAGLLVLAGIFGFLGYRASPRKPFPATRERVETSLRSLKERIA
jgi:hypothetical protein